MPAMTDLLQFGIEAHGGETNWATVRSIVVSFNFYGALLEIKGFPATDVRWCRSMREIHGR
jgi:hypothetical protein